MALDFKHTVTERFLRYVVIDTQSDPTSPTCPRPRSRRTSAACWSRSCTAIGLADAHLDEHGYVYATIPSNTDKEVPVICFCSHMDTSPDCTGTNVKPQIVKNYSGGDIVLPADPAQVIRVAEQSRPCATRSATTSSRPTAPRCSAPTTRPASPRSWMRPNS